MKHKNLEQQQSNRLARATLQQNHSVRRKELKTGLQKPPRPRLYQPGHDVLETGDGPQVIATWP